MHALSPIDRFLNSITMYRLVLYGLSILAAVGIFFAFFRKLPFGGMAYIYSLIILIAVCYVSNYVFSKIWKAPANVESNYITAFILFLIMIPVVSGADALTLVAAGVIAMASKYVFAWHRRHMFNPTAIAAVILGLFGSGNISWWVGSGVMLPFTLVLGLLIVIKVRKIPMFLVFVVSSALTAFVVSLISYGISGYVSFLGQMFLSGPLIFLGTVMLTEPFTTPPKKGAQLIYGVLVGILSNIPFHFGIVYATPELALILGNLFSYAVSPKRRLILTLKEKNELAKDIQEFVFKPDAKLLFAAGQYLEWTLPHEKSDTRGNRRYFTIASSPTENDLRIGVKFIRDGSSFKKELLSLESGRIMAAGQLAGDFILPKDKLKKMAFIAGGIGVTPFRSMIKYMIDTRDKRSVVLFYSVKNVDEIAYADLFEAARKEIGLKTAYVLSDLAQVPEGWPGETGFITKEMIEKKVPDFKERRFYLSGPNAMVESYKKLLKGVGVKNKDIVTDYFPGY